MIIEKKKKCIKQTNLYENLSRIEEEKEIENREKLVSYTF